jgi:predicted Zn-dependent protease
LIRRFGFAVVLQGLLGGDFAGGLGATLIDLSYTREDEAAADAAAVDILRRAGLRADGLARFFARRSAKAKAVAEAKPDGETSVADLMVYFSTHPSSAAREQAVTQQAGEGGAHALDEREWQALREICSE